MNKQLIIGIGVIVILALIGGVYALMRQKDSADGTRKTGKLNSDCKYNDPDLCKFINAWKTNEYYTVTSETMSDGKKVSSVFKSEGKDKSQVTILTDGKESYSTISIGDTTYIRDYADGKWTKFVSQPNDTIERFESDYNFDEKADQTEDTTTYKKIGTEACGDLTCFKYQVIDPNAAEGTQYIYFDNKQYQLRKTRTENKDGAVFETTFDYSRFAITEPSPIKDAATSSANTQDAEAAQKQANEAIKQLESQGATVPDGSSTY